MKCDTCENEATVHEVMIKGGKKVEKHLCERCAVREGMQPPPAATLGAQVVTQFVLAHGQAVAGGKGTERKGGAAAALMCETCGLSFAQFRQTGLLGCPECYEAFAEPLKPLLARAHEGGTHHVGKAPPDTTKGDGEVGPGGRMGSQAAALTTSARREEARRRQEEESARRARIATLKRRLAEAVAAEQYERAAQLRDELQRAGGQAASPGAASGGHAETGTADA
jgi:protein arginine kinase activator